MAPQNALFGAEYTGFTDGPMVKAVETAVTAIDDAATIPAARRVYVQVALELARNIEAGNRKGRAIANEAMQLAEIMKLVQGDTDEDVAGAEQLPEDVAAFLDGLERLPTATGPHP